MTEIVEVGQKTALICDDTAAVELVQKSLEGLGYKCYVSESPERALERLRQTSFEAIVIGERYGGDSIETNPVHQLVASLPMDQRRNSFVFLVGESFATLNAMEAFCHSVHLVINSGQLASLGPILRKSLSDFDLFYRAFRDVSENQRRGTRKSDQSGGR